LGARTPVGLRAFPSAAAVRAGIGQIVEHPHMRDKAGDPFMVAMDPTLQDATRAARMYALATSALDEVLGELPVTASTRVPIFLALPEKSPLFTARQAEDLCARVTAHVA